jgi:hypothetical protein
MIDYVVADDGLVVESRGGWGFCVMNIMRDEWKGRLMGKG